MDLLAHSNDSKNNCSMVNSKDKRHTLDFSQENKLYIQEEQNYLLYSEQRSSFEEASPKYRARIHPPGFKCTLYRKWFNKQNSYTRVNSSHASQQRNRCGCIVLCLVISLLIILSFIIVCAIYFSPVALPGIPEDATYQTTHPRILTLNIFMRPYGIKNNDNDYKDERLDYIIDQILPNYDIITMQEAFAYANRRIDKLILAAFNQGFYYHISSPRHYPWDLAGDGGLLLLSRLPIKHQDQLEFPPGVHSDRLSRKGILHALVQLDNDHLIHIYTTHTQASYDKAGSLNTEDTRVRLKQFNIVHQFISNTTQNDRHPILLMGDLNVDSAVHNLNSSIESPSYESSLAYNMMVDVLKGRGTNLRLLDPIEKDSENNNKNGTNTTAQTLAYEEPWQITYFEDVLYSTYGYHPVTFGDYKKSSNGTLFPSETVLTHHDQLLTVQSIDRMFLIENERSAHPNNSKISLNNITIEHFFVDNCPFTQISDHYGISALIHLE